jgi:hypothetical protein
MQKSIALFFYRELIFLSHLFSFLWFPSRGLDRENRG